MLATMSATGQLQEVQYELHCSICHEYFIQAYTLSCSHSFCFQCINQWTRNHHDCPICRQRIASMTPSRALDNMVATFNNGVPRNSENQTNQVYNVQEQINDSFARNLEVEDISFEHHVSVSESESSGRSWSTFSDAEYDADRGSVLSAPLFNFSSSRDEDESVQSDLLHLSDFDSYEEEEDNNDYGEDEDEEAYEEEYVDEEADEEEYGNEEEYVVEEGEEEEEDEEFDESGYNDVEVEFFSGDHIDLENDIDDYSYDYDPYNNYASDGFSDGTYYDTDYDF